MHTHINSHMCNCMMSMWMMYHYIRMLMYMHDRYSNFFVGVISVGFALARPNNVKIKSYSSE